MWSISRDELQAIAMRSSLGNALKELCDLAVKLGATRVEVVDTDLIVVDERVQLKCSYPPCICYGQNLMCPPYTPKAGEFKGYVKQYKHAIIVQVQTPIQDEIRKKIDVGGVRLGELLKDDELCQLTGTMDVWKSLLSVVSAVEREAFNRGYYLALGLGAGACKLCDICQLKWPCKHPGEARPSMEAVGIDVYKTARNAGLELEWNNKDRITLTGLILVD